MITLGQIIGAHGVRGLFKVRYFTETASDMARYGPVRLEDGRQIQLQVKFMSKGQAICEADEIIGREAAQALKGQIISVPREALPDVKQDEIYHADLLGLQVESSTGEIYGEVIGLYNFGAGDILEIRIKNTDQTEMLPFYAPFLKEIDLPGKKIVLDHKQG